MASSPRNGKRRLSAGSTPQSVPRRRRSNAREETTTKRATAVMSYNIVVGRPAHVWPRPSTDGAVPCFHVPIPSRSTYTLQGQLRCENGPVTARAHRAPTPRATAEGSCAQATRPFQRRCFVSFLFSVEFSFGVPVMQRDTSSSDASASHAGRVRRRRHATEVSNFLLLFALYCILFSL